MLDKEIAWLNLVAGHVYDKLYRIGKVRIAPNSAHRSEQRAHGILKTR